MRMHLMQLQDAAALPGRPYRRQSQQPPVTQPTTPLSQGDQSWAQDEEDDKARLNAINTQRIINFTVAQASAGEKYQNDFSRWAGAQEDALRAKDALVNANIPLASLTGATRVWVKTSKDVEDGKGNILVPAGAATDQYADRVAIQNPDGISEFPISDPARVADLIGAFRTLLSGAAHSEQPMRLIIPRPMRITAEHLGVLRQARENIDRHGEDPVTVGLKLKSQYGLDPSLLEMVPPRRPRSGRPAPGTSSPPISATDAPDYGANAGQNGLPDYAVNGGVGGTGPEEDEEA